MIEKVVLGSIACIVLLIAVGFASGGLDANDPKTLCMLRGGVPIEDATGRLIRCDFPVIVNGVR